MTRDFEWLRSSYCANGACVEVLWTGRCVDVQDSKLYPASPIQRYSVPEWSGLVAAIKAYAPHVAVEFLPSGHVVLGFRYADRHEPLTFTAAEWHAFELGVRAGEFDTNRLSSPAGMAGNLPAPVAAESDLGLLPVKPSGRALGLSEVRAGHDPIDTGEPAPAGGSPSLICGPNGSSPIVPAGRPALPPQVSAGRPGPDFFAPTVEEVEELAAVMQEALDLLADGPWPGLHQVARYVLAAGYVRAAEQPPAEVTEHWCQVVTDAVDAAAPAWGSGPLVEHISDTSESSRGQSAVDAGSVPTQSGAGDVEGSAGPGLSPSGPGPAEPTHSCPNCAPGYDCERGVYTAGAS